jgi:hypothetical protein
MDSASDDTFPHQSDAIQTLPPAAVTILFASTNALVLTSNTTRVNGKTPDDHRGHHTLENAHGLTLCS